MINSKSLGIPGIPASIDTLLYGAMYTLIVDSVPAHLSVIIQALNTNLKTGCVCVLVTQMTPGVFLASAQSSGFDFSKDIENSRLYLFSMEGDYTTNIFRHGIGRFLQEFDYFRVPKESFFLFDQAGDLFTMNDQNIAQTQAMEYRDWMNASGNTALFLFSDNKERRSQSILSCFSGVARINQSKVGLELLIDFWYSEDGAIAAKAFPVTLDRTGFIRVDSSLPQEAIKEYQTDNITGDKSSVFYYGPDFDAFRATINHVGEWKQAQNLVQLVYISREAALATVVISLDRNSDLKQIAEIVHYLRLNRGNRLRIVIKESDFSLRYLNELLFLRLGANLIIPQQITRQRQQLLWELLAGQIYTRKIEKDFELAFASIIASDHKGYVDLPTFCGESQAMVERGGVLDIPLALIIASYQPDASLPEVLSQINIVRKGDIFSSDDKYCYLFMHACAEESMHTVFSHILNNQPDALFAQIRYISKREHIREALQLIVQSGDISLVTNFSAAIEQVKASRIMNEEVVQLPDEASVVADEMVLQVKEITSQSSVPMAHEPIDPTETPSNEMQPAMKAESTEIENLLSRLMSGAK
ncbi:MAG: BcsE family c-di-GMP-binding protein [Proteobacteria bacterium]|nr:BcsE family c-di-GMP-binding protein [Pseudomonadota bacterium]